MSMEVSEPKCFANTSAIRMLHLFIKSSNNVAFSSLYWSNDRTIPKSELRFRLYTLPKSIKPKCLSSSAFNSDTITTLSYVSERNWVQQAMQLVNSSRYMFNFFSLQRAALFLFFCVWLLVSQRMNGWFQHQTKTDILVFTKI